jgi:predicted nucleic acid-binding Zn ribbon protein
MAENSSKKVKSASKPKRMSGEVRRARTMNIIFLVITAIVILSMIIMAVGTGKY